MNDEGIGNPLLRYARVNVLMMAVYETKCLDTSYKDMIQSLRQTSWSSTASEGGKYLNFLKRQQVIQEAVK